MSVAEANKAKLAKVYRAWHDTKGGALDDLIDIFAEAVRFGSLAKGRDPDALTARAATRAETRAHFQDLLTNWRMNHYTVDYLISEGDRVVVVGHTSWTNRATGKTFASPKVDLWRFKDGQAIEFYEYYDTAKLIGAMA